MKTNLTQARNELLATLSTCGLGHRAIYVRTAQNKLAESNDPRAVCRAIIDIRDESERINTNCGDPDTALAHHKVSDKCRNIMLDFMEAASQ